MTARVVIAMICAVIAAVVIGVCAWLYFAHVKTTTQHVAYRKAVHVSTQHFATCHITWPRVRVEYAKLFHIVYTGSYYVIVKDAANHTFILVPKGCPIPKNVSGIVVQVPVTRVVYFSTTEVALLYRIAEHLHRLSLLRTAVGVTWRGVWWIPYMNELLNNGTVKYVGSSWQPNIEEIVALHPQLVVMYTGIPVMVNIMYKLEKVGLHVLVDNEWLEHSYLARFEWIKLIGALYGPEGLRAAEEIFNNTVSTVEEIFKECEGLPKVPFAWFVMYWGKFYVPGTKSYVVQALTRMGGAYVFTAPNLASTGSATVSREFVDSRVANADLIVISGMPPYTTSLNTYLQALPDMAHSPAVKEFRVFELHPSYWQLGYAYTDKVLLQLASLLHPERFRGVYRTFFIPLYFNDRKTTVDNVTIYWKGYFEIVQDSLGHKLLIIPWGLLNQTKYFNPKAFPVIAELEQLTKTVNAIIQTPVTRVVVYKTCVPYIEELGFSKSIILTINEERLKDLSKIIKLHPQVVILDSRYVNSTIVNKLLNNKIPVLYINCGVKSSGFVISLLYNYPDLGYMLFLK